MTTGTHDATAQDHEDNCLMCAVRALTEGDPAATWGRTDLEPGATISGVVLRQGEVTHGFGQTAYVDLWTGGTGRVRVSPFSSSFAHALAGAAAQIGDRLTVRFEGERIIDRPGRRMHGRPYKAYIVEVQRGH